MKTILLEFVIALLCLPASYDDKKPTKTQVIKTSIVALAEEFKETPGKAVARYSGMEVDGTKRIPLIEFTGAMTGFEGKQLSMVTGNSIKVIIIYDAFSGDRPESYSVTGTGRFKEFKNDTVYIVAADVKFGEKK